MCAFLGWLWFRLGRAYDQKMVTDVIANIGGPCLVFSQLISLEVDPSSMLELMKATLVALLSFAVLGALLLRLLGLPRHTFLSPLMFANSGNMGLPLCLFAFGPEGLAYATCVFATVAIVHFTLGVWIWTNKISLATLFRTPLAYAALLAVLVLTFEIRVPLWIRNTTDLLGHVTIPLMLLSLGVSIGLMAPKRLPRTLLLSFVRMGMGFSVGVAITSFMELDGVARSVLILQCTMPVAVFNYLFAQRYNRSPEEVGSLVVVSTLASVIVIPTLLAWLI